MVAIVDPQTISVTAADGHRFDMALYAAAQGDAPVLVFLAAMGTPGRVYRHFAAALAMQGITVCLPDWRGMASSSLRPSRQCNFGYRHLVELDASAIFAEVARRFPAAPVWIGGHSLGGQVGALVAARQAALGGSLAGLVPIASGSVYGPCFGWSLRAGIGFAGLMVRLLEPLLGYFPGHRLGFAGLEAIDVMADWSHVGRTGRYAPRGTDFDYEAALATLSIPVLAVHFPADSWAPEAAVDYLLAKLPRCHIEKWTWNEGSERFDHFSWTKRPERLVERLADRLKLPEVAG